MEAIVQKNEAARLAALRRYHVLDTLAEQAYDDITLIAANVAGTPIALVSLVDEGGLLIEMADQALYAAKAAGHNRVVSAAPLA